MTSPNPPFTAIVAMTDQSRFIGANGGIPWHLPADMRFFRQTTTGNTVIMGRKTFESIGKPLPGRLNVVLSRSASACAFRGAEMARTPGELIERLPSFQGTPYVIGGAEIYAALLPQTGTILLTRVLGDYTGDTFFPPFEQEFTLAEVLQEHAEFRIERWVRG